MNSKLSTTGSVQYRPDIDGLRAVAVLSVMLGHLSMDYVAGGFVGVDIFFVISGYLISSIILKEIEQSRFSILGFYERRIRRIFPALFFMLLVVSIVSFVFLLPSELVGFCNALLATAGFVSNFYYLSHSNYFDLPTTSPLLHTWSLAVEEQFYLLFPPFLLIISRFLRRRFSAAITVVALTSFLLSVAMVRNDQNNAFYMLYTRGWELLIGTMLSQGMFPRVNSIWTRNIIAFTGLLLIAYPVLFYTLATPFPGFNALAPCLGTALIIGAGSSGPSVISAVLSWRPLVFVGLISYSLYLWHWPVIVFDQMGIITQNDIPLRLDPFPHQIGAFLTPHRLGLIFEFGLSFVLATFSWMFIERPFRMGRLRIEGRSLFAVAGALMCSAVVVTVMTDASGGFPSRFSRASLEVAAHGDITEFVKTTRGGICFIGAGAHFDKFDIGRCLSEDSGKRNYLLLGDSKAAMLYHGLSLSMPDANLMQANSAGCGAFVEPHGDRDCVRMMRYIFGKYLPAHQVDGVILCKHWEENDLDLLGETVKWSKEHHIRLVVIGPNPTYDMPLPRLEAYAMTWNRPGMVNQHLDRGVRALDERMANLAQTTWHIPYYSLYKVICPNGSCKEFVDSARSVPMLLDTGHLTPAASVFVARSLLSRGPFQ
ncbi:MAG: acyltransferase family protein [Anaerolineaceae bacterium]|nr:acyltransferase family protein [Anaerolineaceae bacterium]